MQRETPAEPGGVLHLELYVVPKRRRAEFRRRARNPIGYAREITRAGGGSGPYFYRVDVQRSVGGVERLAKLFKVKPTEDLWVEVTFYASKSRRRATVKKIRKTEGIAASLEALESLNSKRSGAWAIANATHQPL